MIQYSSFDIGFLASITAYSFTALVAPLLGAKATRLSLIVSTILSIIIVSFSVLEIPSNGYLELLNGLMSTDTFSLSLLLVLLIVVGLASIAASGYADYWDAGEAFYAVIGLIALGVIVLALANSIYTVYVAWILAAISSYILVALYRDRVSAEASMKYAVSGSVATILLLLSMALLYISRRTAEIGPILEVVDTPIALSTVVLVVVAIGFKMGIVPFHGWLIDVYGNARPILVSVASASAKIIVALLVVRLIAPYASYTPQVVFYAIAVLAAITMTYGNIGALLTVKDSPQKLLAYSSIAQAGYIVAGFALLARIPGADNKAAIAGIALHTIAYAFSKLAGFLALESIGYREGEGWARVKGMYKHKPIAALAFFIALASLAGMPPLLGFWGKLYLLIAVVSASNILALIMAINMAIGAFYYGYSIYMAFQEPEKPPLETKPTIELSALISAILLILAVFIVPPWSAYNLVVYTYTVLAT